MTEKEKWNIEFVNYQIIRRNLNHINVAEHRHACPLCEAKEAYLQGRRDEAKERQKEIERLKEEMRRRYKFSKEDMKKLGWSYT